MAQDSTYIGRPAVKVGTSRQFRAMEAENRVTRKVVFPGQVLSSRQAIFWAVRRVAADQGCQAVVSSLQVTAGAAVPAPGAAEVLYVR
jgi:hypothetical protein